MLLLETKEQAIARVVGNFGVGSVGMSAQAIDAGALRLHDLLEVGQGDVLVQFDRLPVIEAAQTGKQQQLQAPAAVLGIAVPKSVLKSSRNRRQVASSSTSPRGREAASTLCTSRRTVIASCADIRPSTTRCNSR